MSIASIGPSSNAAPLDRPFQHPSLVQKVALFWMKEAGASLMIAGTVACFVSSPAGIGLIASALMVQLTVSLVFHSLGALATYKLRQKGEPAPFYEKALSFSEWVTGINFALLTGYNGQTLVHETGHALASMAVYKNPRPQMIIRPFFGGLTQFYKTSLTQFGKKIGPVGATFLVVGSGPALTLLLSSALLWIGLAIKEKYPKLGKYLICWSLLDFLNHAHYAHSAHWSDPTDMAHDFVHLSVFGLRPSVATVGILAVPTLMILGAYFWGKSDQPKELRLARV